MTKFSKNQSNIKPLSQIPSGSVIKTSEGRRGVMAIRVSGQISCQIYFFGEKKLDYLDWGEVVEVVRYGGLRCSIELVNIRTFA